MEKYELIPSCMERIRKICNENKWSIYRLAKISGIPYSSLNNMFIRNTDPTIHTLSKICYALNISLSDFFSDDNIEVFPIDEELKPLLKKYNKFTDTEKALVRTYIQAISDKH